MNQKKYKHQKWFFISIFLLPTATLSNEYVINNIDNNLIIKHEKNKSFTHLNELFHKESTRHSHGSIRRSTLIPRFVTTPYGSVIAYTKKVLNKKDGEFYDIEGEDDFLYNIIPSDLYISFNGGIDYKKVETRNDSVLDIDRISKNGRFIIGYLSEFFSKNCNNELESNGYTDCEIFTYDSYLEKFHSIKIEGGSSIKDITDDGKYILLVKQKKIHQV